MKKTFFGAIAALVLSYSIAQADPLTYGFDKDHSSIEFHVNHFGYSNFQAEFGGFDGELVFDQDKPEASNVSVTIDVKSIDTGVAKLDAHLKSADFFDVAKYPTMTFKSKSIKVTGKNTGEITGDLTLHGVTKEVVLQTILNKAAVHPMTKKEHVGFSATTTIKRSDFGIKTFIPAIGDEVKINIEIEAGV
ncbi:MAG: polyisoprenoid-binding protein [Methylocystaceae bacterium]|nr:polyisoprenoid-binding protein [Methylocystaceae bacterium]